MIPIDYVFKDGLKPPTIFSPALNGFNEVRMSETVDKNEEGSQGSPQTQWINPAWFHVSCLPAPVAELSADLTPMSYVLSGTMWDMSDM